MIACRSRGTTQEVSRSISQDKYKKIDKVDRRSNEDILFEFSIIQIKRLSAEEVSRIFLFTMQNALLMATIG